MKQAARFRLWPAVEAGLLGLVMALLPLTGYAQAGGIETVAGLALLAAGAVLAWLLTYTRSGARATLIQVVFLGAAAFVAGLVLLAGIPLFWVALLSAIGFSLGLVYATLGRPILLGASLVALALLGHWLFPLIANVPLPEPPFAIFTAVLMAISLSGASLLASRVNNSRLARIWAYGLMVSLVWSGPLLVILDNVGGTWVVPWMGWLIPLVATAVICYSGYLFERRLFASLWAMPRLLKLRREAGDAFLVQGQFGAAVPHYQEALWARPSDGFARLHLGYAMYRLGRIQEALEMWAPVSFYLVARYKEDNLFEQKVALTLLRGLDETAGLFPDAESRGNLVDAIDSPDREYRKLARRVARDADDESLGYLVTGLYHQSKAIRRFILESLLRRGLADEVSTHMAERTALISTTSALAMVHTMLTGGSEAWIRLSQHLASTPQPGSLDLLAEAKVRPSLEEPAGQVWDALREPMFRRLLDALWEEDVALAERAAELVTRLGEDFLTLLIEALTTRSWEEQRRAANQLARLALLAGRVPGLEPRASIEEQPSLIRYSLSGIARNSFPSSIPVVNLINGRQMLLLVNRERYALHIEILPEVAGIESGAQVHFLVHTSDVPVEPSFHQGLDTGREGFSAPELQIAPNQVAIDRLTVKMMVAGRDMGRQMDFGIFVCDADVLNGLEKNHEQ